MQVSAGRWEGGYASIKDIVIEASTKPLKRVRITSAQ